MADEIKVDEEKKIKKVKKVKYKIKKDDADPKVKNNDYDFIEIEGGFVPRDTTFPVGVEQFYVLADLEAV